MDFRAFLVTTAAVACLALGFANAANAQNRPPPAGPVIDEITGQPIIGAYTTRTVDFTATNPTTNLSFAFREDPADIGLDNVSLVDLTIPGGNLVVNGDFEAGPLGESAPTGWTYFHPFGARSLAAAYLPAAVPGDRTAMPTARCRPTT